MKIEVLNCDENTGIVELEVDDEGKQFLMERGFNALIKDTLETLEVEMNANREKAFYDWWMFKASEDGRMTPSAVWDAACDWMKEEMLRRLERETLYESSGRNE